MLPSMVTFITHTSFCVLQLPCHLLTDNLQLPCLSVVEGATAVNALVSQT